MAFGMKHWFGLTVAGLLVVGSWYLPPDAMSPRPREFRPHEVIRAEEIDNEINRSIEVLKRIRWSDSLSAIVASPSAGHRTIGYPTGVPRAEIEAMGTAIPWWERPMWVEISDTAREHFEARIASSLERLDRRADVNFGYFFVDSRSGAPEVERTRTPYSVETYAGERDGQAYCFIADVDFSVIDSDLVQASSRWSTGGTSVDGDVLSYCRPFLRHGLPGSEIMKWLRAGGLNFAAVGAAGLDREGPTSLQGRRSYFGFTGRLVDGMWGGGLEVDRCLAGRTDGCLASLTRGDLMMPVQNASFLTSHSPVVNTGESNWRSPFGVWDDYLLTDLEAEFGSDAFNRFWTSDGPVPEAFEAAFGIEMGVWAVTWVDTNFGVSPPGPRLSGSAALGGLLVVSLMAALGGAWVERRRVA